VYKYKQLAESGLLNNKQNNVSTVK